MKHQFENVSSAIAFGILASAWSPAHATDFFNRTIGTLHGGDGRSCVFFTLDGVAEAVPAAPGAPWFALAKSHPQFKESFALLLAAKLSGKPISISTSGDVNGCGHADVWVVQMP